MRVPILRQSRLLVASVPSEIDDRALLELRDTLIERSGNEQVLGVVVDLSTAEILDSFAARLLRDLAWAIHLRGAKVVLVGIRPEVALAMVAFGLYLNEINVALDLEDALALFDDKGKNRRVR